MNDVIPVEVVQLPHAKGLPLPLAVAKAREYVQAAIASAPGLGHGHGPLNHMVQWQGRPVAGSTLAMKP